MRLLTVLVFCLIGGCEVVGIKCCTNYNNCKENMVTCPSNMPFCFFRANPKVKDKVTMLCVNHGLCINNLHQRIDDQCMFLINGGVICCCNKTDNCNEKFVWGYKALKPFYSEPVLTTTNLTTEGTTTNETNTTLKTTTVTKSATTRTINPPAAEAAEKNGNNEKNESTNPVLIALVVSCAFILLFVVAVTIFVYNNKQNRTKEEVTEVSSKELDEGQRSKVLTVDQNDNLTTSDFFNEPTEVCEVREENVTDVDASLVDGKSTHGEGESESLVTAPTYK